MNPDSWKERMRITKEGNVGIGTTSPKKRFHIDLTSSTDIFDGVLIQDNSSKSAFLSSPRIFFVDTALGSIESAPAWGVDNLANRFRIWNQPNISTFGAEFFTILNSGNVGIGTASPGAALEVRGNPTVPLTGVLTITAGTKTVVGLGTAFTTELKQFSPIKIGSEISIVISITDDTNLTISDVHIAGALNVTAFKEGNLLKLRDSDGVAVLVADGNTSNVGIGTMSPQGKLDVNGAIYQRGGVLHADYVFEDDYKLESIKEHAEFMWKEKHLKGIPKARVDDQGQEIVEVGAHRKGIVEELEKAHIYIEQLKDENEAIKKHNQTLEARLAKLEARFNRE